MKTWILSLCIITSLILFGLTTQRYLNNSSSLLLKKLRRVEEHIIKKQWDKAISETASLNKSWRKTKPIWAILIHHQEIDNIENNMIKMSRSITSKSYVDSRTSSGELQHFLQHIPQREEFTLVNIF